MTDKKLLADLRRQLSAARAERDVALTELAAARAELAAFRTRLEWLGEMEPVVMPDGVGPGEPPLRYVLVDKANARVKQLLGPFQKTVKGLVRKKRS